MGTAQRAIHSKHDLKQRREASAKPLRVNIETIGDWIKVKREAKNLTSGHVAAKMGIAQSVVRSWERGAKVPDDLKLAVLEKIFRNAVGKSHGCSPHPNPKAILLATAAAGKSGLSYFSTS